LFFVQPFGLPLIIEFKRAINRVHRPFGENELFRLVSVLTSFTAREVIEIIFQMCDEPCYHGLRATSPGFHIKFSIDSQVISTLDAICQDGKTSARCSMASSVKRPPM